MNQTIPFARCTRCLTVCGVMRATDARAGGSLAAIDPACRCGAPSESLLPISAEEAQQLLGRGVPPVVLVDDAWPAK